MFRVLKPGGSCLFTVWIRDQERFLPILLLDLVFCNFLRKDKKYGDVMVPWRDQDKKIVAQRFYHLFSRKELDQLIAITSFTVKIIKIFAGKSGKENFFVLLKKN